MAEDIHTHTHKKFKANEEEKKKECSILANFMKVIVFHYAKQPILSFFFFMDTVTNLRDSTKITNLISCREIISSLQQRV